MSSKIPALTAPTMDDQNCIQSPVSDTDVSCHHYEGRSISSRTVLLIKHKVNVENRNYYDVVPSLMYITYCGFIYDVMLWRHYYEEINNGCWSSAVTGNNNQILVAKVAESAEIYHRLSAVCKSETLVRWDMGSSSCPESQWWSV